MECTATIQDHLNATRTIPLRHIMQEVFECDLSEIDHTAAINQVSGWDSLNHISLMMKLLKMGVEIETTTIPDLTHYSAIRAHIEGQGMQVLET